MSTLRCPKSEITGLSLQLVEEFLIWKLSGNVSLYDLPAKTVDAFIVLENEWQEERSNAQRRT